MARSVFVFNTHDLPHRAGEMREHQLRLPVSEPIGVDLLSIKPGESVDVELRITSVDEGVLATGEITGLATGECGRCLDPIQWPIDEAFTELFYYETAASRAAEKNKGKKRDSKRDEKTEVNLDEDELTFMVGDEIDLELPIRDAVILNLPVNPLCDEDCPGLCQGCGEKWINLPEGHAHNPEDPRWAALKGLDL
ncbi:MAG: DUF177 domain-containing protein [Actinobacteria bacterium]|jgi:uncharacterized protein|uniref:Unannotated protein n=1 Tax=freshwater metagenome TaxID=449393 RepID=A0A6J6KG25_9ZZZZ|nr:DUF177 domain-containing protein [Actinomycetota bacterium]MSV64746.1 DUF177 domain-containing protein [Actinomycetota bacterium]MSX49753.1 DUF177 domain-containing protein [Actinomycetota bacterium]MSY15312.1 DUF177 domain-containing protein [Actinomycetota bacterium]MSY64522.1 DUF177 domain-containing protein [Actinomycetota bacterium]